MAPAPAPADAVDRAATAAAGEEAAPGRHAGGATAGGRAGSEVRDGSLPGTVERQKGVSGVKLTDGEITKAEGKHFI